MENFETRIFDSLNENVNPTHLRVSRIGSGESGAPDTSASSGADERPALCNLAGELQDLIITNLHPSAAIALSQTNWHFNSCVNLHRLPSSAVLKYLQEKELLPTHSNDYACSTCLRLKPRSTFTTSQTRVSRGKSGQHACKRICFDCSCRNDKYCTRLHASTGECNLPGYAMPGQGFSQIPTSHQTYHKSTIT